MTEPAQRRPLRDLLLRSTSLRLNTPKRTPDPMKETVVHNMHTGQQAKDSIPMRCRCGHFIAGAVICTDGSIHMVDGPCPHCGKLR